MIIQIQDYIPPVLVGGLLLVGTGLIYLAAKLGKNAKEVGLNERNNINHEYS